MFTKYCKTICSIILASALLFPAAATAQLTQQWVYRYDNSGYDFTTNNCSVKDAAGNLYLAINAYGSNNDIRIVIMKFLANSPGFPVWIAYYGTPNINEVANAITLDNFGNVYVAGQISNNNAWDALIVKYNNNGILQWAGQFNGAAGTNDIATCISVDPSGNVIIAGSTQISASNTDYLVIKYSGSAVMQWVRTYDGPSGGNDADVVNAVDCDASGNIVVTGKAGWTNAGYDVVNLKYTPSGVAGATRYDGAEHKDDEGKKVVFDQSGNYYVTASTIESGNNSEITTMKFSSTNVPQWTRYYDYATDEPTDMKIDASSNVYVTGYSSGNNNGRDYVTIKYHTNGTQLWLQRCNEGDVPQSLDFDEAGNVYVTGEADGNVATVKYNSYGVQIGTVAIYNSQSNGFDRGVAVTTNNNGSNIYVVCMSAYTDVEVIRYSQLVGVYNSNTEVPERFQLSQNYPNPFNPSTVIKFSLPIGGHVKLSVFDISGKIVEELLNEKLEAGNFSIDFNASQLSSGAYFYRIETEGFTDTKKMILVK